MKHKKKNNTLKIVIPIISVFIICGIIFGIVYTNSKPTINLPSSLTTFEGMEEKLVVDYQNKVKYENDKYITVIPTTAQDFINEGNAQHNCVGGYFRYVKEQTSYVVFIRDKKDIEHSLITCEIMKDGRIKQYLKKYNSNELTAEERAFKEEYENYLKKILAE